MMSDDDVDDDCDEQTQKAMTDICSKSEIMECISKIKNRFIMGTVVCSTVL